MHIRYPKFIVIVTCHGNYWPERQERRNNIIANDPVGCLCMYLHVGSVDSQLRESDAPGLYIVPAVHQAEVQQLRRGNQIQ